MAVAMGRWPRLMCLALCIAFSSCSLLPGASASAGTRYVAPLGNPNAVSLVWSPVSSDEILVTANSLFEHRSQVFVLDIAQKKKNVLVDAKYGEAWGESWSPDGSQVAVSVPTATTGFPENGLWILDTADKSIARVPGAGGAALWLPDGQTLAWQSLLPSYGQSTEHLAITLRDLRTEESREIELNMSGVFGPGFSVSPDGHAIAFSWYSDMSSGAADVYVVELDTGLARRLTHDNSSSSPQWSPRGSWIAYVKHRTAGSASTLSLHLMRPDSTCDIEIPGVKYAVSPTWSPDGSLIAFIGDDGIYVLDVQEAVGKDIYGAGCP